MKTVEVHNIIPVGLSRWKDRYSTGLQFRLPVFLWWRVGYDINSDTKRPGWWAMNVLVKKDGQSIRLCWGWKLAKQTGETIDCWQERYGVKG